MPKKPQDDGPRGCVVGRRRL